MTNQSKFNEAVGAAGRAALDETKFGRAQEVANLVVDYLQEQFAEDEADTVLLALYLTMDAIAQSVTKSKEKSVGQGDGKSKHEQ